VIKGWSGPLQIGVELAGSIDGKFLFAGGNNGRVTAHDVKTGLEGRTFVLDDASATATKNANLAAVPKPQ
jgi:hypothetical protein